MIMTKRIAIKMKIFMAVMMTMTSPPSSAVSPQSIESLDMWVRRPRLEKIMMMMMMIIIFCALMVKIQKGAPCCSLKTRAPTWARRTVSPDVFFQMATNILERLVIIMRNEKSKNVITFLNCGTLAPV